MGEVKEDIILTEQNNSIVISSNTYKFIYDASNIKHWSIEKETINLSKRIGKLKEYQIKLRSLVSATSTHTTDKMGTDLLVHTVLLTALRMVLVTEIVGYKEGDNSNHINLDKLNLTPLKAMEHSYVKGMNTVSEFNGSILKEIEDEFLLHLKGINNCLKHQIYEYALADAKGNEVEQDFWTNIYKNFRRELQDAKDDSNKQWNIFFFLNEIQSMIGVSYSVGDRGRRSRNKKLCYDIIYLTALLFGKDVIPEKDVTQEDNMLDPLDKYIHIIHIERPHKRRKIQKTVVKPIVISPSKSPSKSPLRLTNIRFL